MKDHLDLLKGDAAILLRANGDIAMMIPKLEGADDDEAPDHVALAIAFGIVARSPVLRYIVRTMAESAMEAERENGSMPEVAQ